VLGLSSDLMHVDYHGEPKHSISFPTAAAYLDTGNTYQSTIRDSFTISFWGKIVNGTYGGSFFGTREGLQDGIICMHLTSTDKLRFGLEGYGGDAVIADTDAAVFNALNVWKHITITVTKNPGANTGVLFYVNGSVVASTNLIELAENRHSNYTNEFNFYIGGINDSDTLLTNSLIGNVDEFAIWDVALDAPAVAAVYNSGATFDLTGASGNYDNEGDLVGYWRMNEGSGTTAVDVGGSNDATLTGGAVYSDDNV
tara:strand:- start:378 stop:1142 length:765 start_codon:yes stop_codon:yes gene_type:complete